MATNDTNDTSDTSEAAITCTCEPLRLENDYLRKALAEKSADGAYQSVIQKVRDLAPPGHALLWAEVDEAVGMLMQRFEDRHEAALALLAAPADAPVDSGSPENGS